MVDVLEAVELVVGDPPSPPISFSVRSGEILGLLFPPNRARKPLLRALAGIDHPRAGAIHYAKQAPRTALVESQSLSSAFEARPELLLVDAEPSGALDDETRSLWARLAAERECGTAIIVASDIEEQAYRSDRVSLAMWQAIDLITALERLGRHMHQLTASFLELSKHAPTAAVASQMRRLNRAAKDLLAEGRRQAQEPEQVVEVLRVASELAAVSVDDRVLDTLVAQSEDI